MAPAAAASPGKEATPASAGKTPARKAGSEATSVPYDCRGLQGVAMQVCVQCADVPIYKRIVCQQKVFWSACKGKRLFTDSYCQQNQTPGRGEGG
jgi:hypothetical protein